MAHLTHWHPNVGINVFFLLHISSVDLKGDLKEYSSPT